MKNKKILAVAGVVLIVVFVALLILKNDTKNPPQQTQSAPSVAQIKITPSGFEPKVLNVKKGTRVIWVNNDEKLHQLASNPHPSHTDLSGLYSEILNNNQSYEYTANKTGKYGYHDEQNLTLNGSIEIHD